MNFRLLVSILGLLLFSRQGAGQNNVPQIENRNQDTILYCSDSVAVIPEISVKNIDFDSTDGGFKISVINYLVGEDTLLYQGNPDFEFHWDNQHGFLQIKGAGTSAEFEAALKQVYYKNLAEIPANKIRTFSISLIDADYLPYTQHFYHYVEQVDITWTKARDQAALMSYFGLQGYLATITSAVENDFIWSKIDGVGWIAATDEEIEGSWKWAAGPEKGTLFWQGNHNTGQRVNGMYSFWSEGEPNNAHTDVNGGVGEDYGHINQAPDKSPKSWNDLRNAGDGANSAHYRPQGFIVEFGGMPGDPEVNLSTSASIKINKVAFSKIRDYKICQGESQVLNLDAPSEHKYNWQPSDDIVDLSLANPEVQPDKTSVYKVTGRLGTCVMSAEFKVVVDNSPESDLGPHYTICNGETIYLNPGKNESYIWSTFATDPVIGVNEEGWYWVKLTNEFDCTRVDSTYVNISDNPKLTDNSFDTITCGSKQQQIDLSFDKLVDTWFTPLNQNVTVSDETSSSPTIFADEFGVYSFQLKMKDQYQCEFTDTLSLEFHNQPVADFFIDSVKCKGYNIETSFLGETREPATFSWYSNDSVFATGTNLTEVKIPLGFGQRKRTVGLKINEQGCKDESIQEVLVKPNMNFWVEENSKGCTPLKVKFGNTDIEEIEKYLWDFGDGDTSNVALPSHVYLNSDTIEKKFDVNLTVLSSEGCTNSGILYDTVIVHPIPAVMFNFESDKCYSAENEVWYSGTDYSDAVYNWDLTNFSDGEIVVNPGISAGPLVFKLSSEPNVDIGLQVVSAFGCASDTVFQIFNSNPVYDVDFSQTQGCPPLKSKFSAVTPENSDEVEYLWSFGDGEFYNGANVEHVYTEAGQSYDIQLIAHSLNTGCSDTSFFSQKVSVHAVPEAGFNASPHQVYIDNSAISFENKSIGAEFYRWDFGDGSALSDEENPVYEYKELGTFDVKLEAKNNFGCKDSATAQIAVAFERIYPPNAFSPNASLAEDREFRIYADGILNDGYHLIIFNRWGEVIFESKSQEKGWNGKMKNGNYAPAGIYTWVIRFQDFIGKTHEQQGNVTLLF